MSTEPISANNSPLDAAQAAQVNQLAAQLSPHQLTWVSGYLTGLSAQGAGLPQAAAGPSPVLTILYASQTGNARGVAEDLYETAQAKQIPAELHSMADFKPKQLKSSSHIALLASTHGEGDPPDDAEILHELLGSKKAPQLDQLNFAVLAFGDTSYEFFCQTGKDFDERLAQCGANRLMDRVDLDVDFEAEAEAWKENLLETVAPLLREAAQQAPVATDATAAAPAARYTRKTPFSATLATNQKITGRNSIKDIRHVEIDLSDSGIRYEPGDALGVYFKNDPQLVSEILESLQLSPDTQIGDETLQTALTETFELTQLHPGFVADYAQATGNKELEKIAGDKEQLTLYIADRQIVDVITQNPAKLSADALIACLRKLTPRLYSIASSQAEVEEEVHLTVAVVEYHAHGSRHLGGASGFLGRRIEEGDTIKVFTESNKNFRLPAQPDTPIIMIGPGTGIAPFRAFLQERATQGIKGDSWLFFGAPHYTEDFLYQTEWQAYLKDGFLSRIDLAFSRDQEHKIYVQDRIREKAEELWSWIERGAHIYVCGDANRMAKDVHNALIDLIAQYGKVEQEKAEEFLAQLKRDKRYQRDVY